MLEVSYVKWINSQLLCLKQEWASEARLVLSPSLASTHISPKELCRSQLEKYYTDIQLPFFKMNY